MGIECKWIGGSTSHERDDSHAWNQVKIDGKWYNVDLTWDRDNFEHDILIENCLISDEEFLDHNPTTGEYEECKETYDRKTIENCVIKNLSPVNRLKYMKLQKEQEEFDEKVKSGEIKLKPWDLKNYSQEESKIIQNINININKTKEIDEEER